MDWRKAVEKSSDYKNRTYTIPNRWLHIHYYEAFNILFRFENALRVFVYVILKNAYLDKWNSIEIEAAEGATMSISSLAKKRISQAKDFGYLGYEIGIPLMHLNSGELVRLITSEQYWKHFAKYFKGRKEIIRNKLDEIGSIRNSLAHFRPIKEDDVDLIKQNAKHALMLVELCLSEVNSVLTIVPTNTEENWYKEIITLGTTSCTVSLYQSTSSEWIRVNIEFLSKIINMSRYGNDWISYKVLNLRTPNIISLFPSLAKYLTYISEDIPYTIMPENFSPDFKKSVSIVFNKQVLNDNLEEILADLSGILQKVTSEEELVATDNLARGDLIESISVSARLVSDEERTQWEISTYTMVYPFNESHPAEYWGDHSIYYRDFIAGTEKYPWMPSSVSHFDI